LNARTEGIQRQGNKERKRNKKYLDGNELTVLSGKNP
jgi:hypothetical protein